MLTQEGSKGCLADPNSSRHLVGYVQEKQNLRGSDDQHIRRSYKMDQGPKSLWCPSLEELETARYCYRSQY
jgi:hypothetical protein